MEKSKIKMKDKNPKINWPILHFALSFCFLIFTFSIFPLSVSASTVYLETAHTDFFVGDTILVDVKVDSKDADINTIEGKISLEYLPDTVVIRDISVSGSSFSLWTNKPSLSEDLKTISFAGGVPGGLQRQDATVFKIALILKNAGQILLNPTDMSVYLNDGKGTRDTTGVQNLVITVLPQETGFTPINDLDVLISEDKIPPEPFEILAGQDDSVFEGKKFLSFNTIDEQSGIKYYEVREGGLPPVRSNGTYILQNQDTSTKVIVVAYDAAGNARESVYDPTSSYPNLIAIIVSIMLLFVAVRLLLKKKKK